MNKPSELFGFNLTIFNYVCLFALLALGAMLWGGLRTPSSHQDQAAVDAASFMLASLRPPEVVSVRFQNEAQWGCEKSHFAEDVRELELTLGKMAGLNQAGQVEGNYRLPQLLVVDAAVWKDHQFSCDAITRGMKLLLSQQALEHMDWTFDTVASRKAAGKSLQTAWVRLPKQGFARGNPWGGFAGCLSLGDRYVDTPRNAYCAQLAGQTLQPVGKEPHLLPTSLNMLLAEAEPLRSPSSGIYRQIIAGQTNQIQLPGSEHQREVGLHLRLTLNPRSQQIAQQVALCYAGDTVACQAIGVAPDMGNAYYEQARARMTGVAIIDIASGQIEALASADTPCYQQQYDGPGRDTSCPPLPRKPRYKPDMLLNHAVYSDAMPASTVKALLALGLVQTPGYRLSQAQLTRELQVSNSAAFLDHLFCIDDSCAQSATRAFSDRLVQARRATSQVGWNVACEQGGANCGFSDILLGYAQPQQAAISTRALYGRLFVDDKQRIMSDKFFQFNPQQAAECSQQNWRKCAGNAIATPASEAWGQGNGRATALGVAGMFARLGAAANGQESQRRPHLLQDVLDAQGKAVTSAQLAAPNAEAIPIEPAQAQRVVEGLRMGHRKGGTAHSACVAAGLGDCDSFNWIAGKTGTPPFGADTITLEQIKQECSNSTSSRCGFEIPYKWYAALFQSDPKTNRFDKAIAVLSERNWYASGKNAGKVDAPGDSGSNVSAEIAFRVMGKIRQ